jgi:hypothetical protein
MECTSRAQHSAEAHENRSLARWIAEKFGFCQVRKRFVHLTKMFPYLCSFLKLQILPYLEVTMRCGASSVNHALWNSLVIKVCYFLAEMEVLSEKE